MVKKFLTAAVLPALLLAMAPAAQAQTPIPVEDVWRLPAIFEPKLSRNGKYFAVQTPVNGRMNLAVIDLETRKGAALTNFSDFDVQDVEWVGNERLVFRLGNFNAPSGAPSDGGGFFMVSRDGKESRRLSPTFRELRNMNQRVYRYYEFVRSVPDSDEEIIVEGNQRHAESVDLYRLNVRSGRATLLTPDRPTHTFRWILDRNLVPRIVESRVEDTTTNIVWYRKDANSPWAEIARYDATKGPAFVPLAVELDTENLIVATNDGRETMAVRRYDAAAKKLGEVLAQHPRFDMGADQRGEVVPGIVLDPKTEEVVGFRVRAEKLETVWTSERYQRLQRMIDGALPETLNTFTRTPDGTRLIVTSYSDRHPMRWYLLDEQKKTIEELFVSRPWLKPDQLAEMKPFFLRTRDGLEILSYYFLPRNYKKGDKLPTILHIHGGPAVRADRWGDWSFGVREAQLFASRGYAVILPNFRVTPGLGSKVYYSGFGAYGRQMMDDHEDAVKWGIEQGFVDPSRVCISGASYGGYASLMALAKYPDVFKCAVAGLVVSDMYLQLTSPAGDTAFSEEAVAFWSKLAGDPKKERDLLDSISPSNPKWASRIKGAVFMYAGAEDIRTPLEQMRAMRSALERAGNPPKKVVIKAEEAHGFGKLENNIDLYNQILQFLDEQIGPKSRK